MRPLVWLAADVGSTAPSDSSTVVVIGALTVLGTIVTALGPTLLEVVKHRGKPATSPASGAPAANSSGQIVQSGNRAVTLVQDIIANYQQQLVEANEDVAQANRQVVERDATIRELRQELARYQGGGGFSAAPSYGYGPGYGQGYGGQNYNGYGQSPPPPDQYGDWRTQR